jgi:poly(A) polymerase
MSSPPHDSPHQDQDNSEPTIYSASDHTLTRSQIDEEARKVVLRLQHSGFKAFIVGGGVRDLLLGKTPKDFDISTDATPREIKSIFRNCRIIGRRFKLAHVYFSDGKALEVSTFRDSVEWSEPLDVEPGEASPIVSDNVYGTEATDAIRRDLTINGLFLDVATMEIIDYVGGMKDLKEGIVRVIGEPELRFKEDPVRMLRVVRHSARNGFQIDPVCWDAILENSERINGCSQVRVFDELKKDFTSGCFLTILNLLAETGILSFILPELLENGGVLLSGESDFSRCLEILDDAVVNGEEVSPTVILTVIALFTAGDSIWLRDIIDRIDAGHDLMERLGTAFTQLMVPRKERERIQLLIQLWLRVKSTPSTSFKPGSFKRASLLPELITLLDTTTTTRDDEYRLGLLRALEHTPRDEFEDRPHRRSRGRSRRNNR